MVTGNLSCVYVLSPSVNPEAAENMEEELDEDVAVTQSEVNFTCPLTQVGLSPPVII